MKKETSDHRVTTPSSTVNGSEFPAGTKAIVILVITALFALTQLYAAISLLEPVGDALGGNATFALSTSFSLTYAIGFLIWGPISDKFGRKRVMTIAMVVLTLATFLCSFATSVEMLGVLRGVQGLSASGFAPVALAYLHEAVVPERRAGSIGAMSAAFLVAGIFGQVVASTITLNAEWEWFFILCGIAIAICLGLIIAFVPDAPRDSNPITLARQFTLLGHLSVRPAILLLSLAQIMLLGSFVALYVGIGDHLHHLNVDPSNIILIRSAALPCMFVSLAVGFLARRIGMVRVAQAGFVIAAVGMLGEAIFATTLTGLVATSIFYVLGVALAVPSMINLYGETSAPHRGSGMAINGFILFIGASLGPLVAEGIGNLHILAVTLVVLLGISTASVFGFSKVTGGKIGHK